MPRLRAGSALSLPHGLVAVAALAAALLLAAHHPLWPAAATLGVLGWTITAWCLPGAWLFVVPAALPFANLAPWTGWIVFEELDLLVLGAAAAGHARLASGAVAALPLRRPPVLVALAVAVTGAVALQRGLADAGGWRFGWFDGYLDPLNAVRSLKPMLHALLLWPLVRAAVTVATDDTVRRLGAGMLTGLAVVALAAVWERAAYPGILDFTAPYRTTALFWEMHVGGAAIDAYLALSVPFVAWALWVERRPLRWTAAAALALLAGYACLTTFSRGVYAAVALPLLLLGAWLWTHRPDASPARARRLAALGIAAFGALVILFGWHGYSGAGLLVLVLGLALLALEWRGRLSWRTAAALMLALGLTAETLAVFGPNSFMRSRFHVVDLDSSSRWMHWRTGVALLDSPRDWLWGIGLGRFPARYEEAARHAEFPGGARLVERSDGGLAAEVTGPRADRRLGGAHGLVQRVERRARYSVALDVHVIAPADLYLHACERHLLYDAACQVAFFRVVPLREPWRRIEIPLRGRALAPAEGIAARRIALAVSVTNPGGMAWVDNLSLRGPDGIELLDNGNFERGFTRWLPGAQGYYVPWRVDNLYLETLIERGVVGFMALALALWGVLRRVLAAARRVSVGPFLAASLAGGLCLGVASSLLDVPRVAFLFGLLAAVAYELSVASAGSGDA